MNIQKPKVKVPNTLFKSRDQVLRPITHFIPDKNSPEIKNFNQAKQTLINPQINYLFHLNPTNRKLKQLYFCPAFFYELGVKGDITLDCTNINDLSLGVYAIQSPDSHNYNSYYYSYKHDDYFPAESLTINSTDTVELYLSQGRNYNWVQGTQHCQTTDFKLKEINISAEKVILNLDTLPELESIKITTPVKQGNKIQHSIKLFSLPKLKKLDISSLDYIEERNFHLTKVNEDCILKLNPQMIISSTFSDPLSTHQLKQICSISYEPNGGKRYNTMSTNLVAILGLDQDQESPIEISLKDFRAKLYDYTNDCIFRNFRDNLILEKDCYEPIPITKKTKSKQR